jgi:hypothetical protein
MSRREEAFVLQNTLSRRDALRLAAAGALAPAWMRGFSFGRYHDDDALLDELSRRCFTYFADAMDPETGICMDLIHGNPGDNIRKGDQTRGSTGVTDFALAAMCIGAERKWIPAQRQSTSYAVRCAVTPTAKCCVSMDRSITS